MMLNLHFEVQLLDIVVSAGQTSAVPLSVLLHAFAAIRKRRFDLHFR